MLRLWKVPLAVPSEYLIVQETKKISGSVVVLIVYLLEIP